MRTIFIFEFFRAAGENESCCSMKGEKGIHWKRSAPPSTINPIPVTETPL